MLGQVCSCRNNSSLAVTETLGCGLAAPLGHEHEDFVSQAGGWGSPERGECELDRDGGWGCIRRNPQVGDVKKVRGSEGNGRAD